MQSSALADGVCPGFPDDRVCYSSLTASRDPADDLPDLGSSAHVLASDDGHNHVSVVSHLQSKNLYRLWLWHHILISRTNQNAFVCL